ncbi:hypothetical protein TrST_g34 [Triparma strigata]|uniref:Acyltransferase 3 domain-containing protein n=1 Tax=Triparma strigata TaxID=1606541 RepID=A0A9W7AR10_9STRA|nr:hypothetical protein TrST_g34 [Triparma strigata]
MSSSAPQHQPRPRSYTTSIKTSFNSLLALSSPFRPPPPPPPPAHVPTFDSVRSLALLWVISFHSQFFLTNFSSRSESSTMRELCVGSLSCRPLINGHLGVDVFFVLSGLLVVSN